MNSQSNNIILQTANLTIVYYGQPIYQQYTIDRLDVCPDWLSVVYYSDSQSGNCIQQYTTNVTLLSERRNQTSRRSLTTDPRGLVLPIQSMNKEIFWDGHFIQTFHLYKHLNAYPNKCVKCTVSLLRADFTEVI